MSQPPPEPTVLPVTLSAKTKNSATVPMPTDTLKIVENDAEIVRSKTLPINYKNGRKQEPKMFSFSNYYKHKEQLPRHYHPLVQFLEDTEVKYHNDNLFENSAIGFPTRAQILKERQVRLPILKDTPEERARYRRKKNETDLKIQRCKRKYNFQTYDGYSDHCFLTGARFNRNDTIDSKILSKYGMFLNRHNPNSIYIKSNQSAFDSLSEDLFNMNFVAEPKSAGLYRAKSCQVTNQSLLESNLTNQDIEMKTVLQKHLKQS